MVQLSKLIETIEKSQKIISLHRVKDDVSFCGVADLATACKEQVAFLAQKKYLEHLNHTQAGLILISEKFTKQIENYTDLPFILVKDAYLAYACISVLFETKNTQKSIHSSALIHPTAAIADNVFIGENAVIGADVCVGEGTQIAAGVVIGESVQIGKNCLLEPNVVVAHHCIIGDEVRIHAHASIGSEGFGFAPNPTNQGLRWQRIAQLGRVLVGNRVRIGSHTCIDRGAIDDTIIEDDVIIDNLVQIAHNVYIGAGTAMAAKVAIAGSTRIGRRCIIGGAVGISGHLTIADDVTITAMSMVIGDIKQSGSYSSGTAAMPTANWRRAAVRFRQSGEKM